MFVDHQRNWEETDIIIIRKLLQGGALSYEYACSCYVIALLGKHFAAETY